MSEIPVIGMSPGNSYFREEVVNALLKAVVEKYNKTAILIADIPAVATYIALGYPENIAWREKALPNGNNLRNKILRAKANLGYANDQVKVFDWESEVKNNESYTSKYKKVEELYNSSETFRASANDATREVLEYSDKDVPDLEAAVKIGVHYLLSEIAFMEFVPEYFRVDKVVYIYHRNWPVYEKYIRGDFDDVPRPYLGFEVITV